MKSYHNNDLWNVVIFEHVFEAVAIFLALFMYLNGNDFLRWDF